MSICEYVTPNGVFFMEGPAHGLGNTLLPAQIKNKKLGPNNDKQLRWFEGFCFDYGSDESGVKSGDGKREETRHVIRSAL